MKQIRILFICTHNASRSQMAEGYLRALAGYRFETVSAGTDPTQVHPLALRAMQEIGIDLTNHTSKSVETLLGQSWDYIVTVCDSAKEQCPVFSHAAQQLHWSFADPSKATGTEEERLLVFRRIRDEIIEQLRSWVAALALR